MNYSIDNYEAPQIIESAEITKLVLGPSGSLSDSGNGEPL